MISIGTDCLLRGTDLKKKIEELVPIINAQLGAKSGKPKFRQVYRALKDETGVELDLDTFADIYRKTIPEDFRGSTENQIDDILNSRTKQALKNITDGVLDDISDVGETSTVRAIINRVAGILEKIQKVDTGKKVKTQQKVIKDAMLGAIQRLANENPLYKELKAKKASETYEETLERALETIAFTSKNTDADTLNTVEDLFNEARNKVMQVAETITDEDGEPLLAEEALDFLNDYQNAVFGLLLSSGETKKILRGALIDAGYGTGKPGQQKISWKELSGSINSPAVLHENVVNALQEGRGLTKEAAESVANSLASEFYELTRSQDAMNAKYSIAEAEAADILEKLETKYTPEKQAKVNKDLKDAIDKSVETEDELDISQIVHDVLIENGIKQEKLDNLPKKVRVKTGAVYKISKLAKDENLYDSDGYAELLSAIGKAVPAETINEIKRLADLKEEIEKMDIEVEDAKEGEDAGKKSLSKTGIEKARAIQAISDEMARVIARSANENDTNAFRRKLTYALNAFTKLMSGNAALVLLNPVNLTQNISSGYFAGKQAKLGNKVADLVSKSGASASLMYTDPDTGEKTDLSKLLNGVGRLDTWWNSTLGARGRDIPDLFSGDPSSDTKTIKSAKTGLEKAEAYLTFIQRAALTATDMAMKEPFFREELIRGLLFHLQHSEGLTPQEAKKRVYEALTGNSEENLMRQAKQMAEIVGKGNDKYYVKQVAEGIQIASLIMTEPDGTSVLSEGNLQSIINAAEQTSGEALGHRRQKDVFIFSTLYDVLTGGKARAVEDRNKEFGNKMEDMISRGEYLGAAWANFKHNFVNAVGFLFQRGIFNWAILMAQKNPLSIVTGFVDLGKAYKGFSNADPKERQKSVERYLRARAKIGRGVAGTATALAVVPLVMAAIKQACPDDGENCRRKWFENLKKDRVWGRVYKNFVSPFAQSILDNNMSKEDAGKVLAFIKNMGVKPIISAGSKYYSVDNVVMNALEFMDKGDFPKGGALIGGALSFLIPGRGWWSTNKDFIDRLGGKSSPGLIDKDFKIIVDTRKKEKEKDFWDALLWR